MLNVAVSVGATMVTGTLTGIPFACRLMTLLLSETVRTMAGGVYPALPQPGRTRIELVTAAAITERNDLSDLL